MQGATATRSPIEIRRARSADILPMRGMQERSMLMLGSRYYSRGEIESFLNLVGTMEDAVVGEGHFFVALDSEQRVVGSGGWSCLMPRYSQVAQGVGAAPASGPPTVRSVFVAPERARQGIALAMMRRIEADAAQCGVGQLQLTATLSGEGFYRAIGYGDDERCNVALSDGTRFACVRMRKPIADPAVA